MWKVTCVLLIFHLHLGISQLGLENLGSQIAASVQQQLAPLQNLGTQIRNEVERSLLPVRAMEIRNKMSNGIGGITIATYNGNTPRSFIIENGVQNICNGKIVGPQCQGTLEPFQIVNREDFCYSKSYVLVNNNICLSEGFLSVQVFNNQVRCESNDGSPILFVTRAEYQNLCGNNKPGQALYSYYANSKDPLAVPIPNSNPYVGCQNNAVGVCEFVGQRGTVMSSNQVFVGNYNYHS